jgi:predicted GTPase
LVAAVGLIINTQSDTINKSSIRGSSNEHNLIVKSTAKFNFARLICLLIRGSGSSSSSLLIAVFDGGDSPGATAPTLSTHILTDLWFVVV